MKQVSFWLLALLAFAVFLSGCTQQPSGQAPTGGVPAAQAVSGSASASDYIWFKDAAKMRLDAADAILKTLEPYTQPESYFAELFNAATNLYRSMLAGFNNVFSPIPVTFDPAASTEEKAKVESQRVVEEFASKLSDKAAIVQDTMGYFTKTIEIIRWSENTQNKIGNDLEKAKSKFKYFQATPVLPEIKAIIDDVKAYRSQLGLEISKWEAVARATTEAERSAAVSEAVKVLQTEREVFMPAQKVAGQRSYFDKLGSSLRNYAGEELYKLLTDFGTSNLNYIDQFQSGIPRQETVGALAHLYKAPKQALAGGPTQSPISAPAAKEPIVSGKGKIVIDGNDADWMDIPTFATYAKEIPISASALEMAPPRKKEIKLAVSGNDVFVIVKAYEKITTVGTSFDVSFVGCRGVPSKVSVQYVPYAALGDNVIVWTFISDESLPVKKKQGMIALAGDVIELKISDVYDAVQKCDELWVDGGGRTQNANFKNLPRV